MSRPTNRLTARFVASAPAGMHADGAGLYLLVTPEGTASWIFRFTLHGRKRDMGLGSARDFTLAEARERARAARKVLADGLDPIEHRWALVAAVPRLWGEAKADFIAAKRGEWKSTPADPDAPPGAQEQQWVQSLADYGPPDTLPVRAVTTDVVLDCLQPLWKPTAAGGKVETATRVRGRIERIWDAEKVRGTVAGENPARWRGHLEHLLAKPRKVQPAGHFAAMPYAALPAFMATLRERDGLARLALEFTILTAARTEEVAGAPPAEFDLRAKLWRLPGARMKNGEPHVVPLVERAVDILRLRPPGEPPFPLSENGMLALLQEDLAQPYTVHGFRSAFFDWAHETMHHPKYIIDKALAHKIKDKADAAYRRGELLDKRRELMEAWSDFLR